MAGPTKARRRKTPGVPAKPVARKPKSVAAAKPTKTAAAAAPSAAAAKTKLKDDVQTKRPTPHNSSKAPQDHEIAALMDKQKRLQEEISARQREILSLKHLVTALAGGAVPLPVPIELFYRIGQQFVGANAKAFTLTFPPLEQLKPQAGSSVEKTEEQVISGGGWEGEREERTETEREEVDDAGREKREEGGEEEGEETMEATLNHSLESQTDAEANGTPAEAGEVDNEQEEIQQAQEQEQQPQQQQLQQSQQPEQPQQVPPQQQPQQVQQVQQQQQQQPQQLQPLQQAQQQQQQQVQIREQELLHEVSLRAQLAEALSDQNEVLQAQTRLLSEAVAKREKRMKDVEEELRILEGKLCSIAQQAEKLVAAAAATRRGAGKQMNNTHTQLPLKETAKRQEEDKIKREFPTTPISNANENNSSLIASALNGAPTPDKEAVNACKSPPSHLSFSKIEQQKNENLNSNLVISMKPILSPSSPHSVRSPLEGRPSEIPSSKEATIRLPGHSGVAASMKCCSGSNSNVSSGSSSTPAVSCYSPQIIPIDISAKAASLSPAELQVLLREEAKLNSAAATKASSNSSNSAPVASVHPNYSQLLVPSSVFTAPVVEPRSKKEQQRGQKVQWKAPHDELFSHSPKP